MVKIRKGPTEVFYDDEKRVFQFNEYVIDEVDGPIKVGNVIEINRLAMTRDNGEVESQKGIITEDILSGVIQYLESANTGKFENEFTTKAIKHIKNGLKQLEARKADRIKRNVFAKDLK